MPSQARIIIMIAAIVDIDNEPVHTDAKPNTSHDAEPETQRCPVAPRTPRDLFGLPSDRTRR